MKETNHSIVAAGLRCIATHLFGTLQTVLTRLETSPDGVDLFDKVTNVLNPVSKVSHF